VKAVRSRRISASVPVQGTQFCVKACAWLRIIAHDVSKRLMKIPEFMETADAIGRRSHHVWGATAASGEALERVLDG